METAFRIILVLVGIINSLPALLAFLPGRITGSYGIPVPDANYELLLRHRALLFLLAGGLLLYAAATRKYYQLAVLSGLFNMSTFVVLYFLIGAGLNHELRNVMLVDVGATAALLLGFGLFYLFGRN